MSSDPFKALVSLLNNHGGSFTAHLKDSVPNNDISNDDPLALYTTLAHWVAQCCGLSDNIADIPIISDVRTNSARDLSWKGRRLLPKMPVYEGTDVTSSIQNVPHHLLGLPMILLSPDEKNECDPDFLSLKLSLPATLYVLYDEKCVATDNLPSWLDNDSSQWRDTHFRVGAEICSAKGQPTAPKSFAVLESTEEFPANETIKLGANKDKDGNGSDDLLYSIVVNFSTTPEARAGQYQRVVIGKEGNAVLHLLGKGLVPSLVECFTSVNDRAAALLGQEMPDADVDLEDNGKSGSLHGCYRLRIALLETLFLLLKFPVASVPLGSTVSNKHDYAESLYSALSPVLQTRDVTVVDPETWALENRLAMLGNIVLMEMADIGSLVDAIGDTGTPLPDQLHVSIGRILQSEPVNGSKECFRLALATVSRLHANLTHRVPPCGSWPSSKDNAREAIDQWLLWLVRRSEPQAPPLFWIDSAHPANDCGLGEAVDNKSYCHNSVKWHNRICAEARATLRNVLAALFHVMRPGEDLDSEIFRAKTQELLGHVFDGVASRSSRHCVFGLKDVFPRLWRHDQATIKFQAHLDVLHRQAFFENNAAIAKIYLHLRASVFDEFDLAKFDDPQDTSVFPPLPPHRREQKKKESIAVFHYCFGQVARLLLCAKGGKDLDHSLLTGTLSALRLIRRLVEKHGPAYITSDESPLACALIELQGSTTDNHAFLRQTAGLVRLLLPRMLSAASETALDKIDDTVRPIVLTALHCIRVWLHHQSWYHFGDILQELSVDFLHASSGLSHHNFGSAPPVLEDLFSHYERTRCDFAVTGAVVQLLKSAFSVARVASLKAGDETVSPTLSASLSVSMMLADAGHSEIMDVTDSSTETDAFEALVPWMKHLSSFVFPELASWMPPASACVSAARWELLLQISELFDSILCDMSLVSRKDTKLHGHLLVSFFSDERLQSSLLDLIRTAVKQRGSWTYGDLVETAMCRVLSVLRWILVFRWNHPRADWEFESKVLRYVRHFVAFSNARQITAVRKPPWHGSLLASNPLAVQAASVLSLLCRICESGAGGPNALSLRFFWDHTPEADHLDTTSASDLDGARTRLLEIACGHAPDLRLRVELVAFFADAINSNTGLVDRLFKKVQDSPATASEQSEDQAMSASVELLQGLLKALLHPDVLAEVQSPSVPSSMRSIHCLQLTEQSLKLAFAVWGMPSGVRDKILTCFDCALPFGLAASPQGALLNTSSSSRQASVRLWDKVSNNFFDYSMKAGAKEEFVLEKDNAPIPCSSLSDGSRLNFWESILRWILPGRLPGFQSPPQPKFVVNSSDVSPGTAARLFQFKHDVEGVAVSYSSEFQSEALLQLDHGAIHLWLLRRIKELQTFWTAGNDTETSALSLQSEAALLQLHNFSVDSEGHHRRVRRLELELFTVFARFTSLCLNGWHRELAADICVSEMWERLDYHLQIDSTPSGDYPPAPLPPPLRSELVAVFSFGLDFVEASHPTSLRQVTEQAARRLAVESEVLNMLYIESAQLDASSSAQDASLHKFINNPLDLQQLLSKLCREILPRRLSDLVPPDTQNIDSSKLRDVLAAVEVSSMRIDANTKSQFRAQQSLRSDPFASYLFDMSILQEVEPLSWQTAANFLNADCTLYRETARHLLSCCSLLRCLAHRHSQALRAALNKAGDEQGVTLTTIIRVLVERLRVLFDGPLETDMDLKLEVAKTISALCLELVEPLRSQPESVCSSLLPLDAIAKGLLHKLKDSLGRSLKKHAEWISVNTKATGDVNPSSDVASYLEIAASFVDSLLVLIRHCHDKADMDCDWVRDVASVLVAFIKACGQCQEPVSSSSHHDGAARALTLLTFLMECSRKREFLHTPEPEWGLWGPVFDHDFFCGTSGVMRWMSLSESPQSQSGPSTPPLIRTEALVYFCTELARRPMGSKLLLHARFLDSLRSAVGVSHVPPSVQSDPGSQSTKPFDLQFYSSVPGSAVGGQPERNPKHIMWCALLRVVTMMSPHLRDHADVFGRFVDELISLLVTYTSRWAIVFPVSGVKPKGSAGFFQSGSSAIGLSVAQLEEAVIWATLCRVAMSNGAKWGDRAISMATLITNVIASCAYYLSFRTSQPENKESDGLLTAASPVSQEEQRDNAPEADAVGQSKTMLGGNRSLFLQKVASLTYALLAQCLSGLATLPAKSFHDLILIRLSAPSDDMIFDKGGTSDCVSNACLWFAHAAAAAVEEVRQVCPGFKDGVVHDNCRSPLQVLEACASLTALVMAGGAHSSMSEVDAAQDVMLLWASTMNHLREVMAQCRSQDAFFAEQAHHYAHVLLGSISGLD